MNYFPLTVLKLEGKGTGIKIFLSPLEPILVKAPYVIRHSNKYSGTLGNATVVMGTLRVTVLSGEINPLFIR